MQNTNSKRFQAAIAEVVKDDMHHPTLEYLGYYPPRDRVVFGLSASVCCKRWNIAPGKDRSQVELARIADYIRARLRLELLQWHNIDCFVQVRVTK